MSFGGICVRPQPCLNASLGESEVPELPGEPVSLETSPGVAAWEARPQGDELLDHLCLGILHWDESLLETLSPKFLIALREAVRKQDGFISKICNSFPVRVMSYMMLPCTLPMESAIAVVQRLVMWLPHVPDDIQWLQWAASRVCSRVVAYLLPTSRSQTPVRDQQPDCHKPEHDGHPWPLCSS